MTRTATTHGATRIGALGISGFLLAGCASSGTLAAGTSAGPGPTGSVTTTGTQSASPSAPSTSSSSTGDPTSDPAASDSTSAGGTSGVVTGTKLKSVFPANSELPAGYKRHEQSAIDSGDHNRDSPGSALMPGDKCVNLTNTGVSLMEGDFAVSYAEFEIDPPENAPESFTVSLKASGYLPGDAVKEMKNVRDMMARCKTFTTHDMSSNAAIDENVTLTPVPGLGDEAVEIKIVAAKKGYFNLDLYLVRVGDVIVGADLNVGGAFPATLKGITAGMATKAKNLK